MEKCCQVKSTQTNGIIIIYFLVSIAIEFMDSMCLRLVEKHLHVTSPITEAPFYVLIEVSGSQESHDREKLDSFLERVMEEGDVNDGTVATDRGKLIALWSLRERIAEALNAEGTVYKVGHEAIVRLITTVLPLAV